MLCIVLSAHVSALTITKDLTVRNRGSDVVLLQQFLKEKGYFTFPRNTGYFGPYTFAAVKKFQKANNLPETGIVDAETRALIEKLTAPAASTTSQNTNCHAPIGFVCDPHTNMPMFILTSPPGYGGGGPVVIPT